MSERKTETVAGAQGGLKQCIAALLRQAGESAEAARTRPDSELVLQPLFGDGSTRRFFRVFVESVPRCIAVLPASNKPQEMAEAMSAAAIGGHLHRVGVPVPALIAAAPERGLILFEDLGNVRLHDILRRERQQGLAWYPEVIAVLAHMQVCGARDFKRRWCCDTPVYDRSVMLEREADYFHRAFWQQTLYAEPIDGFFEECEDLADRIEALADHLFLHRDFQSRNIMIKDGAVRVIDFQAGRLGPPGYDIASLLVDPYAGLSNERQEELWQLYLQEIRRYPEVDVERLEASYPYLAIQRNLQIIGAFAYLSGRKKKTFFRPYIIPALVMLHNRLADSRFDSYPVLRRAAAESIRRFRDLMR